MNPNELKDYVLASGYESGSFGVKIFVKTNRKFTDNDRNTFSDASDKLVNDLRREEQMTSAEAKLGKKAMTEQLKACFGGRDIYMEEIPNEYSSMWYYCMVPWFIVTTSLGRIKIGWRKRVIEINWEDAWPASATAAELFPDEDVTKDGKMIHAWGYDKAAEYINKLLGQK